MIQLGRLCVKTAGRDAGKKCVVIDLINDNYAVVDGELRRKKCNIRHLEPLDITIKINRNATHEEVVSELSKIGVVVKPKDKKKVKAEKSEAKEQPAKESKPRVKKA